MDINSLVKCMLQTARKDCVNGKGRIIVPDFVDQLYVSEFQPETVKPTVEEMVTAWQLLKPNMPIHRRGENCLIIELGREAQAVQQSFEITLAKGEEIVRE